MKKPYVKPIAVAETFEVNESISACTLAANGVDTSIAYGCSNPFHFEQVTFGPALISGIYRVYNKDGQWIGDGHLDSSGRMVWTTIDLGVDGAQATTDHISSARVAPNHS